MTQSALIEMLLGLGRGLQAMDQRFTAFRAATLVRLDAIAKQSGPAGKDGAAGRDGKDGEQGPAGKDGQPGQGFVNALIRDGKLVLTRDNGSLCEVGPVIGPRGEAGEPGRDGEPGPAGKDGEQGPAGRDGEPGPAGRDGKDGKNADPSVLAQQANEIEARLMAALSESIAQQIEQRFAALPPAAPGRDGKDGEPGPAGRDGEPGPAGKDGERGPAGKDGKAGPIGQPGPAGKNGRDGEPGPAGRDGEPGPGMAFSIADQGPAYLKAEDLRRLRRLEIRIEDRIISVLALE